MNPHEVKELLEWTKPKNLDEFYNVLKENKELSASEIRNRSGLSSSTVHYYGKRLQDMGLVEKNPKKEDEYEEASYTLSQDTREIPPENFENLININRRQLEILRFLGEKDQENREGYTVNSISDQTGIKRRNTERDLKSLAKEGYVDSNLKPGKTSTWIFRRTQKGRKALQEARKIRGGNLEQEYGHEPKEIQEETGIKTYTEEHYLELLEEKGELQTREVEEILDKQKDRIIKRMKRLSGRDLLNCKKESNVKYYSISQRGKRTFRFWYPKLYNKIKRLLSIPENSEAPLPYENFLLGERVELKNPSSQEGINESLERLRDLENYTKETGCINLGTVVGHLKSGEASEESATRITEFIQNNIPSEDIDELEKEIGTNQES